MELLKEQVWWTFTWAVESLQFCTLLGSFCKNHIKFQPKKYRRLISHDIREWCKVKEKLTCSYIYDMRSLMNFHPTTQKSKNFTLMHYFCPKYMRFELKKYRGVIFHDIEQWCKIWINPGLRVSKVGWGIWHWWTFIRAPKSLKNCTLIGSFFPKHITFQI